MAATKPRIATNSTKQWGLYTYIAGDNNLSSAGLRDIREMEKAGAADNIHVAVQIDTAGEHTGSVRYEITAADFSGKSHRMVIERLDEQNTGEPRYLADFARWAAQRYPARNRLLVVWNHGAGFMHEPTRDIAYDDSSKGDALTMGELRWALANAGFGKGRQGRLSILGFDACLMNMVEVAYEFADIAEYIVGSQQTEPGDGWPYDKVLAGAKSAKDAGALAAHIVAAYIAHYRRIGSLGVTQSAVRMAALPAVAKALGTLGSALLKAGTDQRGAILEARVVTQGYDEATYVDAIDLADNLAAKTRDAKIKAACDALAAAVKAAVTANASYGDAVARSNGLSVWFPLLKTDYVTRRSEYVALRHSKDYPGWVRFLDWLLAV